MLHRIPEDAKQLAGQYELPSVTQFSEPPKLGKVLLARSRGITNKRIKETIYRPLTTLKVESSEFHWIALNQLSRITLSGPHRRWVNELFERINS